MLRTTGIFLREKREREGKKEREKETASYFKTELVKCFYDFRCRV